VAEIVTLATAVVVLATAVATWRTRQQVRQVHVLVNSRMSDMERRVRQLTAALEGSDTAVPPAPEREDDRS
jgi:hypothetical protein